MKRNQIGKSNLYVSEIGLGCMSLGTNEFKASSIIDEALSLGINYLDTADLYDFGENEHIVGRALKGKRENVILATKVGNRWEEGKEGWHWDPSKKYIKAEVKESLRRLQTDYIDLYQLHGGTIEDPLLETIEAFEELKEEGVIRYYGISSIRPNVIKEFIKHSSIDSVMMQYSLLDRRPEEEILDLLHEHHISVIARGPLSKGILTNNGLIKTNEKFKKKLYLGYSHDELVTIINETNAAISDRSLNDIALRYALHHPAVAAVIPGASSIHQVHENTKSLFTSSLSSKEYETLRQITRTLTYNAHR
jgi:aryl-alcohol dehydrogenase-like predicted oxidoreductase